MPKLRGDNGVHARKLIKDFNSARALDGVDLDIPPGRLLGLLGPNGAGKTTTVRVLSTLLRADSGQAWVAGHDVRTDPHAVRRHIGLSGQYATVDENLTGFENLYLVGRCYGLRRKQARARAAELLGRFGLEEIADRRSRCYSGGMRRRLDLAGALVAAPPVLILDEPTTGLDPRGRLDTWDVLKELVAAGSTVLLTTQYLEEADQLADNVIVIDRGRVLAEGTPAELKARTGGERLRLAVTDPADLPTVAAVLSAVGTGEPVLDRRSRTVEVPVETGPKAVVEALRRLESEDVRVADVALHGATLDDVFLSLTGHGAR